MENELQVLHHQLHRSPPQRWRLPQLHPPPTSLPCQSSEKPVDRCSIDQNPAACPVNQPVVRSKTSCQEPLHEANAARWSTRPLVRASYTSQPHGMESYSVLRDVDQSGLNAESDDMLKKISRRSLQPHCDGTKGKNVCTDLFSPYLIHPLLRCPQLWDFRFCWRLSPARRLPKPLKIVQLDTSPTASAVLSETTPFATRLPTL